LASARRKGASATDCNSTDSYGSNSAIALCDPHGAAAGASTKAERSGIADSTGSVAVHQTFIIHLLTKE
jgi:hypothetical protein